MKTHPITKKINRVRDNLDALYRERDSLMFDHFCKTRCFKQTAKAFGLSSTDATAKITREYSRRAGDNAVLGYPIKENILNWVDNCA